MRAVAARGVLGAALLLGLGAGGVPAPAASEALPEPPRALAHEPLHRIRAERLPGPLRPWAGWVLWDVEDAGCPVPWDGAGARVCAWPEPLELTLDGAGGRFRQRWQVYGDSWVTLPGGERWWPVEVRRQGAQVPVLERGGRPVVRLVPGSHELSGRFVWATLPESVLVPADAGVVRLRVHGVAVDWPRLDAGGRLWLGRAQGAPSAEAGDTLRARVFRRVVDEVPLLVETRWEIEVSGGRRDVVLGGALARGCEPVWVAGDLPARVDESGGVRVPVRPGAWSVAVGCEIAAPVASVSVGASPDDFGEEVWSFESRPSLRTVRLQGQSVDPAQVGVPPQWRHLPAFRPQTGADGSRSLAWEEVQRGASGDSPDRFAVSRQLWLDFDGGGYTARDRVTGTVGRSWRFEADARTLVGRVSVHGVDQVVTQRSPGGPAGVELRRGAVSLEADSRLRGPVSTLPAVGWAHDAQSLQAELRVPPGWELVHASGVDAASPTWWGAWSLLDFFVVLLMGVGAGRAWGWRLGLLAFVALALTWHAPGAPRWVWLWLLATGALARVVPAGRLARAVRAARYAAAAVLVVQALPYAVVEVRSSLYPQLAPPLSAGAGLRGLGVGGAPLQALPTEVKEEAPQKLRGDLLRREALDAALSQEQALGGSSAVETREVARRYEAQSLDLVDPKAKVPTGPGLPSWQWRTVRLSWNGPVTAQQPMRLWYLPPPAVFGVRWARVALVGLLAAGLWLGRWPLARWRVTAFAGVVAALALPGVAWAQGEGFPSEALLGQLRERLLAPAACAPACANVTQAMVSVRGGQLEIELEVCALDNVAVGVPGGWGQWVPQRVTVGGSGAGRLARDASERLWVEVPEGVHRVVLAGPVVPGRPVLLRFPARPWRVAVDAAGWEAEGLDGDRLVGDQLVLSPRAVEAVFSDGAGEGRLPPVFRVERTLVLGLDWRVLTRVVRAPGSRDGAVVRVGLLAGESVLSERYPVRDGAVEVSVPQGEGEVGWESSLRLSTGVSLRAPPAPGPFETWRLDAAPVWHVEQTGGIAAVHDRDEAGQRVPQWRPWPGESVDLAVMRPEGAAGSTLTVDAAQLVNRPGSRATASSCVVELRSSVGADHALVLPPEADVHKVVLDGSEVPLRRDGVPGRVGVTLGPGAHRLVIEWTEPRGMGAWFETSAVDLGAPHVNASVTVEPGRGRWVLAVGGGRQGPAVLFWGVLVVVALVAVGLGRWVPSPLSAWQWGLLGVGLTQGGVVSALVVVAWFAGFAWRENRAPQGRWAFNLAQLGLAALSVAFVVVLFEAVRRGLLGSPQMQIAGNGSGPGALRWYWDRGGAPLEQAWVLSVPLWVYRGLMLAWGLWLATALAGWARWAWGAWSGDGFWRSGSPRGRGGWRRWRRWRAPLAEPGVVGPEGGGGAP